MNALGNILFKSLNKGKHNCITYPAHERTQSYMADTNANFYMLWGVPGVKDGWESRYAEIPHNHTLLKKSNNPLESLPGYLDWSFVLSHAPEQYQVSNYLCKMGSLSHIQYRHTWPREDWSPHVLDQYKSLNADINVFISRQSLERWGYEENEQNIVIEHGVDSEVFSPQNTKQNRVLFQGNLIKDRSYILGTDIFFDTVVSAGLPYLIVGNNPGISQPAPNVYELVKSINTCSIYANFARESPLPMSLLEAMSCGLAPVSVDTCMASELIEHGVNGYKSNNANELQDYIKYLLDKPEEAKRIGIAARETVLNRFNLDRFTRQWNEVFDRAASLVYKG